MQFMQRSINILILLLLALFTLSPLSVMAESEEQKTLEYTALGDSLAAGYLNEPDESGNRLGNGYPVFIQQGIEDEHDYEVNLTNAGVGGFTTEDVLDQLLNNTNNILQSIEEADLITIGAGANDLLQAVDLENLDPENLEEIIGDAQEAIVQVETNMTEIFEEINNKNQDAPVYVLGYYNALPYLEDMQDPIVLMIDLLNETIKGIAIENGAIYIPTFEAFDGKHELYLPNPDDIHPTEEGYEVIADLFLEEILPIEPIDREEPVITLNGDNEMELEAGEDYIEPGAAAADNVDGDLTDAIEIDGEVHTDVPGEYIVTYTVSDAAGNNAEVKRTVVVVDTEAPVITLNGDEELQLEAGEEYVEPGATAEDIVDGDLTEQITISSDVNTEKAGEYMVTYSVSDTAGNEAIRIRTVNVIEPEGEQRDPGENLEEEEKDKDKEGQISQHDKNGDHEKMKDGDVQAVDTYKSGGGGELPDTATNHPLFMVIGTLMVFVGGAIAFISRKIVS
ncbi:immunoglobulin-like domain-containing protein [Virgibacillus kimchii]